MKASLKILLYVTTLAKVSATLTDSAIVPLLKCEAYKSVTAVLSAKPFVITLNTTSL